MTRPSRRAPVTRRSGDEGGVALILALLAMILMMALGAALILTTVGETQISANFRNTSEGRYAADAALELAVNDLLTVSDWNQVLNGSVQSPFVDGAPVGPRTLPNGTTLDLGEVVNRANCAKPAPCSASDLTSNANGERPWGANNPVWQLYAYGPVSGILAGTTASSPYYVVVLVGDDPSEDDGDPWHDGDTPCPSGQFTGCNPGSGVVAMRAEAFGPREAHTVIEMTVARTDLSGLERGYAGQRGDDPDRRRRGAVQSPGQALTQMELSRTSSDFGIK